MPISPSRIARLIAGQLWPDVQHQQRLDRGVYSFSCAGHGGLIAIGGVADLSPHAFEVAERCGMVELVLVPRSGRGKTYTTHRFTADSLRELAARRPDYFELVFCWTGEEDCDRATILFANDVIRLRGIERGERGQSLSADDVRASVIDWNPDFYEQLTGDTIPAGVSHVKDDRLFAEAHAGDFVSRSAWGSWHERVPDGMVGILVRRDSDKAERGLLVSKEAYDARDRRGLVFTDAQLAEQPTWDIP
jgi:hypothetical protein